ncbi:hypothetical protein CEUSTIGMA_g12110.t1 [Chlamydomonas eustigma]|uniref:Integrase catalytic domain-containing protein n=1 Tax=Chlamydomonas eustigma TaxID=1157962 RepID=A0A250XP20_9CHLO|nr:hypothetical protein CEUSTIGMA_g12110.t1 [Chlamydomonas eustigma]|eukprot:GAX84689.1 hypothetical protein CEUSTIGMA_g12110.t1 [Chlamydomonas eustigma]
MFSSNSTTPALELFKIYVSLATSESLPSPAPPGTPRSPSSPSSHTFTSIKTHMDPALFTSKNSSLSQPQQAALHDLLRTHHSTFDEPSAINDTDSVETFDGYRHRIQLQPGSRLPPTHRLYRMSPAELEELHKQLQIYFEKGWIGPSSSEYGAPVLFARKPDGSLRLCIDYRSLNAQTIKDCGPLPLTSELFDHLHGAKYLTSLDLWSGYHQCRIHPDDSHKTAFKTRYGLYEFTVMPFGLTNAPAAFMRQMSHVLKAYLDKFVVCYLDDVLIYSKTEAEHLQHIQLVLEAFDRCNLKVKLPKCSFAQSSTRFLGYLVSAQGLSVDPKKVSAVPDWPLPSDLTSVRSFLGFTGFYRRFIRDYAKLAAPLTDLTRSTVPFPPVLPPSAVDSFNQLKAALLSAPFLLIPYTSPDSTFILYTDASTLGLGAVLLQDQGHGPQPVCYESRKLTPAEHNYSVHELELLAIVHAVKIFRHYLEGCKHFTLYTDHHSLRSHLCDPALRLRLLHEYHDTPTSGHPGYLETLNAIASHYYWPGMTRTVKTYVSSCATCQRIQPSTQLPPGLLQPHTTPSRPWSHVSMDLITDLPSSPCYNSLIYDSIVTFVDMLTKPAIFVHANKTITAPQLANVFIDHVFSKHGLPSVIVSDRDTRITSDFWQSLFSHLGSKLNLSTAYHPQTDGQTEITHRTIEQILRAYVSPQHDDWSTWLPLAEFAYNSHVHSSTLQTPFYANYGFHPTAPPSLLLPTDSLSPDAAAYLDNLHDVQQSIIRELDLAKARQAESVNRHCRDLTFKVGDRVRLSSEFLPLVDYPSTKLRPRFLGPFTISHIISPVSYRLALPTSLSSFHPVFHVSRLLPWTGTSSTDFPARHVPTQPLANPRDYVSNATPVHSIVDCSIATDPESRARPKSKCLFFKIKWAAPCDDTWEPMRSVSRLQVFKDFLLSPAWHAFVASDAYKAFAKKFKSKLPKVVHFNLLVS